MLLLCTYFTQSGATEPQDNIHTLTAETSFQNNTGPAPPGSGYDDNCEQFLPDGSGLCSAWSSSINEMGFQKNFFSWYRNGTRHGSKCLMVNGAPCGMVPDYTINRTASRGGLLTERKVVTQAITDKILCMDPDCSFLKDVRHVESFCRVAYDTGMISTDWCVTHPDPFTAYASEVPLENIIKNIDFLVGRQVVLEKLLNTSSNGESETFFASTRSKHQSQTFLKYKQDINITELTYDSWSRQFIKIPDTALSTIFSKLYQNQLQPVIRYQYVNNSCVLVIVPASETCTLNSAFTHGVVDETLSKLSGRFPIKDTCSSQERIKETWLALDPETVTELILSDETHVENFTVGYLKDFAFALHAATTTLEAAAMLFSCIHDSKHNSNCSTLYTDLDIRFIHHYGRNWIYYNITSGAMPTSPSNNDIAIVSYKLIDFQELFEYMSKRTFCYGNNTSGTDLSDEVGRWVSVLYPYLLSVEDNVFSYDEQVKTSYSSLFHQDVLKSCNKVINRKPAEDMSTIGAMLEELETNTLSNLTPTNTIAGAITSLLSALLALAAIIAIPNMLNNSAKQIFTSLVASVSISLAMVILLINEREARSDNSKTLFVGPMEISHEVRSCQNVSTKYITFVDQSSPGNSAVYAILGSALAMCICATAVTISRFVIPMCRRGNVVPHI